MVYFLYVFGFVAPAQSLTVFAASSLTNAFTELETAFEAQYPSDIAFNFAASSILASQIIEGAPADIFASADIANMSKVLGDTQVSVFAKNKLVVITNKTEIKTLEDLATQDYLLVLAGEEVPAGKYARNILEKLGTFYGADYSKKVLEHLVSNEVNVRQAVSKVMLGEADVAMVYLTDVQRQAGIQIIEIPDDYNVQAEYPIAVLPATQNQALAQDFVDFVLSKEGQEILRNYGFLPE